MAIEYHIGTPVEHRGLTVWPLFAEHDSVVPYRLAEEAIEAGTITVRESTGEGTVPELLVENHDDVRVLFLEGEQLVGAKQNRVLNASLLVAAGSSVKIPVSCVEQHRWHYRSPKFGSSGHFSSPKLRHTLARSVSDSLETERGHRSDQSQVWEDVRQLQACFGTASETGALEDTFHDMQEAIVDFQTALGYVKGALGLVAAVGSRVVSLDLFDKPSTCEKLWSRLVSGMVLDALAVAAKPRPIADAAAQTIIDILEFAPWKSVHPVGEGEEYRAEMPDGAQRFRLCHGGSLIHARVLAEMGA